MSTTEFCLGQGLVIDMNVTMHPSTDDNKHGGGITPPSIGPAPGVLPEVQTPVLAKNSQTGVSTENGLSAEETEPQFWYVIRCTYGREKKACEYLKSQNIEVYCPTLIRHKLVDGHHRKIEESRLPNLFFAYDTFSHLKTYVYDNTNQETKSLRFYYQHSHKDSILVRQPVVIPTYQMDSLKKICAQEKEDILMVTGNVPQFNTGQTVRITEGKFKGVIGKVARYQGQQRVAVIIDGLFTAITAYVPSAFLKEE